MTEIESQIANYRREIELKPQQVETYQLLAETLVKKGELEGAIACYQKTLELQPNLWGVYQKLADIYRQQKQPSTAVATLEKAIELNPNFPWFYHKLGEALLELQRWEEAVTNLRRAVALNPNFPWSYNKLGEALVKLGRLSEAIATYKTALKLQPKNGKICQKLGNIFRQQGNLEEAILAYNRAIILNPNFSLSYKKLGEVLAVQKRWDEAIYVYLNAVNTLPEIPWMARELGNAFSQRTQWGLDETISYYRQAIKNQSPKQTLPTNPEVYLCLGNALAKKEWFNGAIVLYNIGLEIKPNYGKIINELEKVLKIKQQLDREVKSCQLALEKTTKCFENYYNLAVALTRQEEWDKAADAYLNAIKSDPKVNWSYYRVWDGLRNCGKLDEAVNFYRQKIEARPNLISYNLNLGDALTQQNRIEEAVVCYQKVAYRQTLKSNPNFVKKHWHRAIIRGPDFMIIGTGKGGTTSLYSYLTEHPQVLPAIKKEVHFWSLYFSKGIDWYLAHFPRIAEGKKILTGEATPSYLNTREVATKLFDRFLKIKLIAILRNPVSRTVSHYNHEVRLNKEHRSFEEAITTQLERFTSDRDPWNDTSSYITDGLYVEFLKHWMNIFPREQFLILKSEDFYVNPVATMKEVFNFLELPDYQVKNYQKLNSGSYDDISESSRRQLSDFFQPYNQELEDYLGMTFNWE